LDRPHSAIRGRNFSLCRTITDRRDAIQFEIEHKNVEAASASEVIAVFHVDDKCGVVVGEPGLPIDTGTRKRPTGAIVPKVSGEDQTSKKGGKTTGVKRRGACGAVLKAGDHDFHRATATPSVSLDGVIPETPCASWCQGDVTVTLSVRKSATIKVSKVVTDHLFHRSR
jgi:hypothetical protein